MSDSAVVSSIEQDSHYLLSFGWIIEQEARKVARRCHHLLEEDLYSEVFLHALDRIEYIRTAAQPGPYLRVLCRQFLTCYAIEYDSLIRSPRLHGGSMHADPISFVSLDCPLSSDSGATLADLLAAPEEDSKDLEVWWSLRQALEKLSAEQRGVLLARFAGGSGSRLRPLRDVAKDCGLSTTTVHRIIDAALVVLRQELVGEVVTC